MFNSNNNYQITQNAAFKSNQTNDRFDLFEAMNSDPTSRKT